jgi:hypothetical protein
MAKQRKNVIPILLILTGLAFFGVILGFVFSNALVVIIFLLPTIIYEIYRTEGRSTKSSSWGLLFISIAEIVLIIMKINFDIAKYLGTSEGRIAGYEIPFGDVKIVGPTIMAVLSVVLFIRTWGPYTKWLAVVIFLTSFVIIYLIDPDIFSELLQFASKEAVEEIQ